MNILKRTKNILLLPLPLFLLGSCSITPPQPPFKTGEVFLMTGTSKAGVAVTQKYTLRGEGKFNDDTWEYRVFNFEDGLSFGALYTQKSEDVVVLESASLNVTDKDSDVMKALCVTFPTGKGWKTSDGIMIYDTLERVGTIFNELEKQISSQGDVESNMRGLIKDAGTCTITRQ